MANLRARLLVLEGLKLDSLDIHIGYVFNGNIYSRRSEKWLEWPKGEVNKEQMGCWEIKDWEEGKLFGATLT